MVGYTQRLYRNSYDVATYREYKYIALELLGRAGVCTSALKLLDFATLYTIPVSIPLTYKVVDAPAPPEVMKIWSPFHYHPHAKIVIAKAVSQFNNDVTAQSAWQEFFGKPFEVNVAWRVSAPPLFLLVR